MEYSFLVILYFCSYYKCLLFLKKEEEKGEEEGGEEGGREGGKKKGEKKGKERKEKTKYLHINEIRTKETLGTY